MSGGTSLFTTKVDTNFSFGGNLTPASAAPSSSKVSSHEQQQQRAYSFNNPPPMASAGSRGESPREAGEESAGFQSTFRLPSDRGFGKRKQESLATEDGSGEDEDPDKDDDDFVGVGGGVNWQL